MSDASLAIAALATAVTAVAPVRTGRAALETTSATLPVITIWSTDDRPATDNSGYGPLLYTRTLVVEVKTAATESYHSGLDDALTGIRRALQTSPGNPFPLDGYAKGLRQTAVRFFAPADNGAIAAMQVTLEIDYLERL